MTSEFEHELDKEHERLMRLVQHASAGWAEAMRGHKLAPPDLGFARRLQALSAAAATEQVAWEQAHDANLMWRPVPGAEHAEPPYELRPGTGRRGPADLWERFDAAVANLNRAIAGSDAAVVAAAFGDMARAAGDLAAAVKSEDEITREAAERARPRDAA